MIRPPAVAAAVAAALLLTGCAADTRGELRRGVADITDDANARDADGVRNGVDRLLDRLDSAVRAGEVDSAEAARIAELARLLRERAGLLEPEEPEPTEEPTQEPTEEPTEEPTPEPTRAPPPSPSPPPAPSPPPSPAPSPEPPPAEPTFPELPGG